MIKAIYLFYVFKFAPRCIDNTSHKFWRNSVTSLNKERAKTGEAFYLWKLGRLYIRDPHSTPMKTHWTSSYRHPFCWRLNPPTTGNEKE